VRAEERVRDELDEADNGAVVQNTRAFFGIVRTVWVKRVAGSWRMRARRARIEDGRVGAV